jgi:hypothetical protein
MIIIRVTLDTNIIIKATKPNEVDHELVVRLLELHKDGYLEVQVVAANASERNRSMIGATRSLQADLASLGLSPNSVKILPTIGIVGMAYLDYFYLPSEEIDNLMHSVWNAMFFPTPMDHQKFCQYDGVTLGTGNDSYIHPRWQNYMCDVMTVVQYIQDCQLPTNRNDVSILVTADHDDILKHLTELEKLGAKQILGLKDALFEIENLIAGE